METESILDVSSAMEAALHQRLDSLLTRRTSESGQERIPFRFDFQIRRQARDVDGTLGLSDGLLVERCNAHGERFNEPVEFGIRQRPVDVAVPFGEVAVDIIGAE